MLQRTWELSACAKVTGQQAGNKLNLILAQAQALMLGRPSTIFDQTSKRSSILTINLVKTRLPFVGNFNTQEKVRAQRSRKQCGILESRLNFFM